MNFTNDDRADRLESTRIDEKACCDSSSGFSENLTSTQMRFKLGFANNTDVDKEKFQPIPISFLPWTLSQSDYSKAVEIAKALSKTLERLSSRHDYLLKLLESFKDESSLIFKLKNLMQEPVFQQTNIANNLNLSRFDFLLDSKQQWKLVESNTIAAGMGPFSQKLGEFYSEIFPNQKHQLAENPAIKRQAAAMYSAAKNRVPKRSPNIVFVIEEKEDNVFDQDYLIVELQLLGASVHRKTLCQLKEELSGAKQELFLKGLGKVDLLYFRTGYNLQDYTPASHCSEHYQTELLQMRGWIEKHEVIVSPSISHQLASSKWVQIELSKLTSEQLKSKFKLSSNEAKLASQSLKTKYKTVESLDQIEQALDSGNWILKNQNEGGGNTREKISKRESFHKLKHKTFLMKKINSSTRRNVCRYYKNEFECDFPTVSELGIFIVGEQHKYAGYLARSKPASKLEGGVHSGDGFLDLVAIKQ